MRMDCISDPLQGEPDARADIGVAGEITGMVRRWAGGDRAALDALMPMVYEELRRLAEHHVRAEHADLTMPGTGLVHEAYLRLASGKSLDMRCRAQFFGYVSTVMRHVLVDNARARRAAKRDADIVSLDADTPGATTPAVHAALAVADDSIDLIALDESLRRLEALDAQQARVVEMRFFVGLGVQETAEALQLSAATVKREWATARAWLLRDLGRDIRRGRPVLPAPQAT